MIALRPGQRLLPDQQVHGDGLVLIYQGDGNLVLYRRDGPQWATNTFHRPGYVEMQGDGNLVMYDADVVPVWDTGTFIAGAHLEMNATDGLKVVALAALWSTPALPPPPVVPPGSHVDPWDGHFRIVDGAYVGANGEPKLPVICHAGDLIGQGLVLGLDAILPAIDRLATAGYHAARCWFQLHLTTSTWVPGPTEHGWDPRDNPLLFKEIVAAFDARQVKLNFSGGGLKGLGDHAENELFDLLADTIADVGPQCVAQVAALNEARDTGDEDDRSPQELLRLVERVRSRFPELLYATTAYTGVESKEITALYTPSYAQHSIVNGYRAGRANDKLRHIFSFMREGTASRQTSWQDEPFGVPPGVSAQDNGHELDAHVMKLAACMSAMASQAWTYFCGSGVVYRGWDGWAGFDETPAIVRQLPQDMMRWPTLSHSNPSQRDRIHTVRPDSPNVRGDYAIAADGRVCEIIYGPPGERRDLPVHRATTDVNRIEDGPWGSVTLQRIA